MDLTLEAVQEMLNKAMLPMQTDIATLKVVPKPEPIKIEPALVVPPPSNMQGVDPQLNAEMHRMKQVNKELSDNIAKLDGKHKAAEAKAEAAEKAALVNSAIDAALEKSQRGFTKSSARAHIFNSLLGVIESRDGQYLAPGNLPVDTFVHDALLSDYDYALNGGASQGTGFSPNGTTSMLGGAKAPQYEDITAANLALPGKRDELIAHLLQVSQVR